MTTINYNGENYDYDLIVSYMDDEIREELHSNLCPCTEQEFFDAYIERDTDFTELFKYDILPV